MVIFSPNLVWWRWAANGWAMQSYGSANQSKHLRLISTPAAYPQSETNPFDRVTCAQRVITVTVLTGITIRMQGLADAGLQSSIPHDLDLVNLLTAQSPKRPKRLLSKYG